jgi:hypothetical protein
VGFLIAVNDALAHAQLLMQSATPPRLDASNLKSPPCGGVPRTDKPAVFSSGETVQIQWKETINHPGYYTIALSTADDDFQTNGIVLIERYDDMQDGSDTPHYYSSYVTMPEITCRTCTLQLIQVMTERTPPNDKYYSCADVALVSPDDRQAPSNATGVTARQSGSDVQLQWQNPAGSYQVIVLQNTAPIDDVPLGQTGYAVGDRVGSSTVVYKGNDTAAQITNLNGANSYYYFKVIAYDENYNYASGVSAFIELDGTTTQSQPKDGGGSGSLYGLIVLLLLASMFRKALFVCEARPD